MPLADDTRRKKRLILAAGADRCEILPFTPDFATLSAKDFMLEILKNRLRVEVLMLGYDNHFGHRDPDHPETFDDYQRYGREMGIEVLKMPPFTTHHPSPITHHPPPITQNSTFLRHALREGDISLATELLGRHYSISGLVVHGRGEGHRIGFPTANLAPESVETILPKTGVYAVKVRSKGVKESGSKVFSGMMNIGTRPTYNGTTLSLEVHLFNFDGDLYGQTLTIDFLRRIRDEQPFESPEALRKQLEKDRADCGFSRSVE